MIVMLPSEKAKELLEKFDIKHYALVCCDEAIKSHQDREGMAWGERDIAIIDYWKGVKKQIEKL